MPSTKDPSQVDSGTGLFQDPASVEGLGTQPATQNYVLRTGDTLSGCLTITPTSTYALNLRGPTTGQTPAVNILGYSGNNPGMRVKGSGQGAAIVSVGATSAGTVGYATSTITDLVSTAAAGCSTTVLVDVTTYTGDWLVGSIVQVGTNEERVVTQVAGDLVTVTPALDTAPAAATTLTYRGHLGATVGLGVTKDRHGVHGRLGFDKLTTTLSGAPVPTNTVFALVSGSAADDYYVGATLKWSGQYREVLTYVGATKTVTLRTAFTLVPLTGDTVEIVRAAGAGVYGEGALFRQTGLVPKGAGVWGNGCPGVIAQTDRAAYRGQLYVIPNGVSTTLPAESYPGELWVPETGADASELFYKGPNGYVCVSKQSALSDIPLGNGGLSAQLGTWKDSLYSVSGAVTNLATNPLSYDGTNKFPNRTYSCTALSAGNAYLEMSMHTLLPATLISLDTTAAVTARLQVRTNVSPITYSVKVYDHLGTSVEKTSTIAATVFTTITFSAAELSTLTAAANARWIVVIRYTMTELTDVKFYPATLKTNQR